METGQKSKERTCCFTITGEFITDISRQLWGPEGNPDKGMNILHSAFPEMPMEIKFAVLTGYKKLTGDSTSGIYIKDDDQANEDLSLTTCINKYRTKIDKLKDELQMAEGMTEFVPSCEGLVEIPRRRTIIMSRPFGRGTFRALDPKIDLYSIPFHASNAMTKAKKFTSPDTELQREGKIDNYKPSDNYEPSIAPPPLAKKYIDKENGWLSPEGKFYGCIYGDHISLANQLGIDPIAIEKLKWLKVQNKTTYSFEVDMNDITQAQRNVLFIWYKEQEILMPKWLKPPKE